MIQFELTFKNKPVRVDIKEDGLITLHFSNGDWLLLLGTDIADRFTIIKSNIAIAKEDFILLGKLLYREMKQGKQMDRIHS